MPSHPRCQGDTLGQITLVDPSPSFLTRSVPTGVEGDVGTNVVAGAEDGAGADEIELSFQWSTLLCANLLPCKGDVMKFDVQRCVPVS